jgi:hypothetical protein
MDDTAQHALLIEWGDGSFTTSRYPKHFCLTILERFSLLKDTFPDEPRYVIADSLIILEDAGKETK